MNESAQQAHRQLDLDTSKSVTEIRRDYINDTYVLVAPKRQNRPFDMRSHNATTLVETADSPRLDLQETVYERLDDHGEWTTKVVENKYPALTSDNPLAFGRQELVIDTPLRNVAFGELDVNQIHQVLLTYQNRAVSLAKLKHIAYVAIFRNDGADAGASLAHAHSQICALPLTPPRVSNEAKLIEAYIQTKDRDPYDDILKLEFDTQTRIIQESDPWLSFCPYASTWQMEAWIMPKQHITSLGECSESDLFGLATHLLAISRQLTQLGISHNLTINQGSTPQQRLTIKILGRSVLSPPGGLEVMTDLMVNPIPPESAADWYRRGI